MEAWDYALARALRDLPKGQIPVPVSYTHLTGWVNTTFLTEAEA